MTYYADLSPYTRAPDSVPAGVTALNVGWLSWTRRFPRHDRGRTPEEHDAFVAALALLCRDGRRAETRGFHPCGLAHRIAEPRRPIRIEVAGLSVPLGNAEVVAVTAGGTWLIAPSLVHHYVTRHRYRPPEEFVRAVLDARSSARGAADEARVRAESRG